MNKLRGFAAMKARDPERQRQLAAKGGRATKGFPKGLHAYGKLPGGKYKSVIDGAERNNGRYEQ